MDGFIDSGRNASVRGYILRSLVKGYHFSALANALSAKLMATGLISSPDISGYLYYLEQKKLIEFNGSGTTAFNVMEKDEVVRLTAEGIQFIERGGDPETGVDL